MFATYPETSIQDARDKAISLLAQIRNGQNPSQDKKSLFAQRRQEYQQFKTSKFSIICEKYRQGKLQEKGNNSLYFSKQLPNNFAKYVTPFIGNKALQEITRDDLRALLNAIPTTPMRRVVHAQLAPVFGYAIDEEIITTNPFDGIKLPAPSAPRERVLSKEEIRAFWLATAELIQEPKPLFGHLCRALLLSAARLNEVAKLELGEINEEEQIIAIPSKRMKNRKPFVIPIAPFLREALKATPRKHNKWVYSYGKKPLSDSYSKAKALLDARMEKHLKRPLEPFVLHSLRHTFSTIMASKGQNLEHISLCLAHTPKILKGVDGNYNHYAFIKEKRAVLEDWANYISEVVK